MSESEMAVRMRLVAEMAEALGATLSMIGRASIPGLRRAIHSLWPIAIQWSGDYSATGEPPFGGAWSRWQLRAERWAPDPEAVGLAAIRSISRPDGRAA